MVKIKYSFKALEISKEIANGCTNCKKCMQECVMMNDFEESPQDIFGAFLKDEYINPIIPYSCSLCNKCTTVCPKNLEIPKAFMGMRESIIEANGGKSHLKGHNAVYMHQLLSFGFMKTFTIRRS
ncbi:MAG: 4Fe-4S dicluster domain-containing protein [Clostridiaceae bacterium]|nr:4Fe-4S dicluster domain-containing protein [Clostridiaceae bacterium]